MAGWATCAGPRGWARSRPMEPAELVSRDEVTAMLFSIADINAKLSQIVDLLEGGIVGEEWPPEDDA